MRSQFILPSQGLIKPTDKIPLGSYIDEVEEMQKKTIDPVTGRLFIKHSLQDDINAKLEREKIRMEKRFEHIETEVTQQAKEEERIIREMTIDSDRVMPDAKTRHWMLAQTHLVYEEDLE